METKELPSNDDVSLIHTIVIPRSILREGSLIEFFNKINDNNDFLDNGRVMFRAK